MNCDNQKQYRLDKKSPFFALAPMDDVTDTVFRQVIAELAPPDIYFTEFVNVDGLQSVGRSKLLHKLLIGDNEGSVPVIAQIWGKNPDNYYKTVKQLANGQLADEAHKILYSNDISKKVKNFVGVDINMGCPDKTVVKNGCCSALINNRKLAMQIIESAQAAAQEAKDPFPVSVKTRVGFTTVDLSWIEKLLNCKLNMLSVHLRTTKDMSKIPARWDLMQQIVDLKNKISPATILVGNGDVINLQQGKQLAKKYGLDGIMIGRGIFNNPYIFTENSPWSSMNSQQKMALYKNHIKIFAEVWKNKERHINTLNKFCKIYIQGFSGAKETRERLMQAKTIDELLLLIKES